MSLNVGDLVATLRLDSSPAERDLRAFQARTSRLDTTATVRVDLGRALADVTALKRLLGSLDTNVTVRVDLGAATADLAALKGVLGSLDTTFRVRADTATARADIAALKAQLDGLSTTASVQIDSGGDGGAGGGIGLARKGMVALIAAAVSVVPAIVPIGGAAVAAFAAVGAAASGPIPAIASVALAFHGVGDALKAMGKAQDDALSGKAGAKAAQQAQQVASAAQAIRQAEQGVSDAREAAGRAAAAAARQVQDATRAVSTAEQEAARSVGDALTRLSDDRAAATVTAESGERSVASAVRGEEAAERDLITAQEDAKTAQDALTGARKTAKEQLEDLSNRVTDGALSQRQAVLAVQDAQAQLAKTQANPASTAEQQQKAQLGYDQAVQSLREQQLQNSRLTAQQQEAAKAGVDGSAVVVAAQKNVAQASQKVTDATEKEGLARQGVADAQEAAARANAKAAETTTKDEESVTRARIDGAARVQAAQRSLTDALVSQSQQQADSVKAVSRAVDNLTAASQAAKAAPAVMSDLAVAMSKLTPVQQEFTRFLFGLQPMLKDLQGTAAAAFLPGLQATITSLLPLVPSLNGLLDQAGGAMARIALAVAGLLTGPTFRAFFDYISTTGIPVLESLVMSGLKFADAFTQIMVGLAPLATAFAGVIGQAATQFLAFTSALVKSPAFQQFIGYIIDHLPGVETLVEQVFTTIGALITGLAPYGDAAMKTIGSLLTLVSTAAPAIGAILGLASTVLGAVAQIATPLIAALTPVILLLTRDLIGVIGGLMVTLMPVITTLAVIIGGTLMQVLTALQPIFPVLVSVVGQIAVALGDYLGKVLLQVTPYLVTLALVAAQVITAIAPLIPQLIDLDASAITPLLRILPSLYPAFVDIAHGVVDLVRALVPLIPSIIDLARQLIPVIPLLVSFAVWVIEKITPGLPPLIALLVKIAGWLVEHLVPGIESAAGWLGTMWGAFDEGKRRIQDWADKAGGAWDTMKNKTKDGIKIVVGYINDPLISGLNHFTGLFGIPGIPPVGLPRGFSRGGWTGDGAWDQPAGVVHADEFVIRKDSRRKIEAAHPGLLNAMNATGAVGYSGGGLVDGMKGLWGKATGAVKSAVSGIGSAVDPMAWLAKALNSSLGGLTSTGFGQVLAGAAKHALSEITGVYTKKAAAAATGGGGGGGSFGGPASPPGGAVERWRGVVLQALGMLGQSPALANGVLSLIRSESGGVPDITNTTDSNARAGHPSRGLMQTIPGTFERWRSQALPDNIVDPLANVYAGINYALHTYGPGMLAAGGRHSAGGAYKGYAKGGRVFDLGGVASGEGFMSKRVIAPERVLSPQQTKSFDRLVDILDKKGAGGRPVVVNLYTRGQEITREDVIATVTGARGALSLEG